MIVLISLQNRHFKFFLIYIKICLWWCWSPLFVTKTKAKLLCFMWIEIKVEFKKTLTVNYSIKQNDRLICNPDDYNIFNIFLLIDWLIDWEQCDSPDIHSVVGLIVKCFKSFPNFLLKILHYVTQSWRVTVNSDWLSVQHFKQGIS